MEITENAVVPEASPVTTLPPETLAAVKAEINRRPATIADLIGKKRRQLEVTIQSVADDGSNVELLLQFQALDPKEYDDLVAKYPPTAKQKTSGMEYNPETFGPALVAAVSHVPALTVQDVKALIESGNWSPGEIDTLTGSAYLVCQQGAGVPFTVSA